MSDSFNFIFSSADKLSDVLMTNGNFYIKKIDADAITTSGPVTVIRDNMTTTFQNVQFIEHDSETYLMVLWNTDGHTYTFTMDDGSKLSNIERTEVGYYISDIPITQDMISRVIEYAKDGINIEVSGLQLSQTLDVKDKYWFHLRDFGDESYSLIFNNGYTLSNLIRNSHLCYISDVEVDPSMIYGNCDEIRILRTGAQSIFYTPNEIERSMDFVAVENVDDKWFIRFRFVTPEEKQAVNETNLAKAQVAALSERNQFLEDCIAELAAEVYSE